jgi:hypothetical protein
MEGESSLQKLRLPRRGPCRKVRGNTTAGATRRIEGEAESEVIKDSG